MKLNESLWEYIKQHNYGGCWKFIVSSLAHGLQDNKYTIDTLVGACCACALNGSLDSDSEGHLAQIEERVPNLSNDEVCHMFRQACLDYFNRHYSKCLRSTKSLLKKELTLSRMLEYVYYLQTMCYGQLMIPDKAVETATAGLKAFTKSPIIKLAAVELEQQIAFLDCPDLLIVDLVLSEKDPVTREYYLGNAIPAKGRILLSSIDLRDYSQTNPSEMSAKSQKIHGQILREYEDCPELILFFCSVFKGKVDKEIMNPFLEKIPSSNPDKLLILLETEPEKVRDHLDVNSLLSENSFAARTLFSYIKRLDIEQKDGLNTAISLTRALLKHEPLFFPGLMLLGKLLIRVNDLGGAVKSFQQGLNLLAHSGDRALEPTQTIIKHGNFDTAGSLVEIASSKCSSSKQREHNLLNLLSLAIEAKEWDHARNIFFKLIAKNDQWFLHLPTILVQVQLLWRHFITDKELFQEISAGFLLNGRDDELKSIISDIRHQPPASLKGLSKDLKYAEGLLLVNQLILNRQFERALEAIDSMLSKTWNGLFALQYLQCLIHAGAVWRIPEVIDAWLEKYSGEKDLPVFIATFMRTNFKDNDDTLRRIDSLIDTHPDMEGLYKIKVEMLLETEKYQQGLTFCSRAIERFPNENWFLWMRGRFLASRGEHEHALATWTKILEIEPSNGEVITSLLDSLEKDGLDIEAINILQKGFRAGGIESDLLTKLLIKLGRTGHDRRLEYEVLYQLRSSVKKAYTHFPSLRKTLLKQQGKKDASLENITNLCHRVLEVLGPRTLVGAWHDSDGVLILLNPIKVNPEIFRASTVKQSHELLINAAVAIGKEISDELEPSIYLLPDLFDQITQNNADILQRILNAKCVVDFGMPTAFKFINKHLKLIRDKFERYLMVYSIFGSFVRGEATQKSDLDAFFILDDTVIQKEMTSEELVEAVRKMSRICSAGLSGEMGVNIEFNMQIYTLTQFWNALKDGNPIIVSILKDAVPFYDVGILRPWKNLFQRGELVPSRQATERYLTQSRDMVQISRKKIIDVSIEALFNANLMLGRAALMVFDIIGSHPRETSTLLEEKLVNEKKLISKKSVNHFRNIIALYKKYEHGERMDHLIESIPKLYQNTETFCREITKIVEMGKKNEIDEKFSGIDNSIADQAKALNLDKFLSMETTLPPTKEDLKKIVNNAEFADFLYDYFRISYERKQGHMNYLRAEALIDRWNKVRTTFLK